MSLEKKADFFLFTIFTIFTQHPLLFFSFGIADKGSLELMKSADKTHAAHVPWPLHKQDNSSLV